MKFKLLILLFIMIIAGAKAQTENPYEVIRATSIHIDAKIPVLDSLFPIVAYVGGWGLKRNLSKKERKELIEKGRTKKGFKLQADSLEGNVLISALPVYEAFNRIDTASVGMLERMGAFYMIGNPLFFAKRKAVVFVCLWGRYAQTYLLHKRHGEWKIVRKLSDSYV